jgi:hypothetical protein
MVTIGNILQIGISKDTRSEGIEVSREIVVKEG